MHRRYFPACPVDGPIDPPVAFGHGASHGAVPNKCSECVKFFEGECTRFIEEVGHYLYLDHGPCGINGPTEPVEYQGSATKSKALVPRKCAHCKFLMPDSVHGFCCAKDPEKWGDFPRGLDWGTWVPKAIYINLPQGKKSNENLSIYAANNDEAKFLKEYRYLNPTISMVEAKSDFENYRSILERADRRSLKGAP